MNNKNESKYDITKSNFFREKDLKEAKEDHDQKYQNSLIINTSSPNIYDSKNLYQNNNSIPNSTFYPSSHNLLPYQKNQFNFYSQSQSSIQPQSFIEKVSSTAMNLIKKEDPINLINDISPNEYEENLKNSNKKIKCQILNKSKINNIIIKPKISNPRKINDSIVKNSYILYDINTPELKWLVNRRYSDFIWLRETLCALFPNIILPQLPKKKMGNRRFEEDFIEKRQKGLQLFLDKIVENENLKSCESLVAFLSFERSFFEQQMKIIIPKNINIDSTYGIRSFDGIITVADLDNDFFNKNNYFNSIKCFFNYQNDLIKNMKENLNNYNIHMVEACLNLEEIENGFSKLSKYYIKANLTKDIYEVFERYQIFFKNWKRIYFNQASIIREKINEYFKYMKNIGLSMNELIERQNIVQKDYSKIKEELINKKEDYWIKKDITKWEINPMDQIDSALLIRDKNYAFSKMCFQETQNINNKGDLIGYYYFNNLNNIKIVLNDIKKFSINNIFSFSKEIEQIVTDIINVWSNLVSNL